MHAQTIENGSGNIVDVIYFCSDACHRDYCAEHDDIPYSGWNGCHEGSNVEFCAQCGVVAGGVFECHHQNSNIVVNRFRCDDGEKCECGHWLQLPTKLVERMG